MVNLKLEIPDSFFDEEVRDGYLVTSQMKKVWAVELDLLAEAMRVMDKFSIRYYAIGGTLLGAVRHRGFIPWDDDIDIALPRRDYEVLKQIAPKEFSAPYFFQEEKNSPGLLCGHAKLRNSETTMIHSNHLKDGVGALSFNMGVFIDFFPMDNLPDDIVEREKWLKELRSIARKAWHLRMFTHRGRIIGDHKMKYVLQSFYLSSLIRNPDYFFDKYEDLLSKYANESTTQVCAYCQYCRDKSKENRFIWENKDLDVNKLVLLPFEMLKLPCPVEYDSVLTRNYGNWHKKVQAQSQHGSASESFYDVDNPYTRYLNESGCLDRQLVRGLLMQQQLLSK